MARATFSADSSDSSCHRVALSSACDTPTLWCSRSRWNKGNRRSWPPLTQQPSLVPWLEDAAGEAFGDGSGAVADAQLGVDVQQVGLDGGFADAQQGAGLPVGGTGSY